MKKKLFSLLLAAVMLSGAMLTACSNEGTVDTTPAAGDDSTPAVETDAPEGKTEEAEPAVEETQPEETEYVYTPDPANQYTGGVGVSQYGTSVSYTSIKVTNNADRKTLLDAKFDDPSEIEGWNYFSRGSWDAANTSDWTVSDGSLNFTNTDVNGASIWTGDPQWGNYNLTVKGTANEGIEGLGVYFGVKDASNYYYFNLGGWNNTVATVEWVLDGQSGNTDKLPIKLNYGEEYTISISVGKDVVYGYLNGEQLFQIGGTAPANINQGAVGFGSYNTEVMYDNIKVTDFATGEVLYENDFETAEKFAEIKHDLPAYSGGSYANQTDIFENTDGTYHQTSNSVTSVTSNVGDPTWRNYIYTIDFMPVSGAEGSSLFVGVQPDVPKYTILNVGGWSNTLAAWQWYNAGENTDNSSSAAPYVTTQGEWNTAQFVVLDYAIFAYINGELVTTWWQD